MQGCVVVNLLTFAYCMSGPGKPKEYCYQYEPAVADLQVCVVDSRCWQAADMDGDGDIDLRDWVVVLEAVSAPTVLPERNPLPLRVDHTGEIQ